MYSVVIVTDESVADGFRLAGARVETVPDEAESINALVTSLIEDDEVGIIAINRSFMEKIDNKVMGVLEKGVRPIILPIPDESDVAEEEPRSSYIAALVQKSIGFKIELKK